MVYCYGSLNGLEQSLLLELNFECYFYLNGDFSHPAFKVTLLGHCELAISSIYYTVLSHCFGNDNTVF